VTFFARNFFDYSRRFYLIQTIKVKLLAIKMRGGTKWAFFGLFFCLCLVLALASQKVFAAFIEPANQPPEGNAYEFLRIDGDNQAKSGKLRLGSDSTGPMTYQLEVLGEGAVMNQVIADNNIKVNDSSNTLFVDAAKNRVCVGSCLNVAGTRLEVSGGSLAINGGNVTGLSAYSTASGANTEALYGQGATAGIQGAASGSNTAVLGWAQGTAVAGFSTSGHQIYGNSLQGVGVYGANTNYSGLWAGYFSGRLETNNDVSGAKFVPTALGPSLVPYTVGQTISEYAYPNANPAYFDGTYIWAIGGNKLYKIRANDGFKIFETTVGTAPTSVAFDGQYIWVTVAYSDSTPDRILKLNPLTGSGNGLGSVVLDDTDNPQSVVFDGLFYWAVNASGRVIKFSSTCANLGAINTEHQLVKMVFDGMYLWALANDRHVYKINPSDMSYTDFNGFVGSNPQDMLYDNYYFWVANQDDDTVTRLYADVSGQLQVLGTYAVGDGPKYLAFDGGWLWVANTNSSTVTRLSAADPRQDGTCSGGVCQGNLAGQSCTTNYDCNTDHRVDFSLGYVPVGMNFDGTHIWVGSNGTALKKYYSGRGWSTTDLSGTLTLQNNNPLIQQNGSISITGSGRIGQSATAAVDLSVAGKVWGTESAGDTIGDGTNPLGPGTFSCPDGHFVKNIVTNGAGEVIRIECRPL
jgi:hypothetical protein